MILLNTKLPLCDMHLEFSNKRDMENITYNRQEKMQEKNCV